MTQKLSKPVNCSGVTGSMGRSLRRCRRSCAGDAGGRLLHTAASGVAQRAPAFAANHFVSRPDAAVDWRDVDLAAHRVARTMAGRYEREGIGVDVLGSRRSH